MKSEPYPLNSPKTIHVPKPMTPGDHEFYKSRRGFFFHHSHAPNTINMVTSGSLGHSFQNFGSGLFSHPKHPLS